MAKGGPNKRTIREAELTEHHVVELIGAAVREIEEKLTKTVESMISGLDEKITEKVRVHQGDSQPGEEQIKSWIAEAIKAGAPSTVPASASRVSPSEKGIYPTLASLSPKREKERSAALIERYVPVFHPVNMPSVLTTYPKNRSHVHSAFWSNGVRLLDRKSPQFTQLVKNSMTKVLHVTDANYMNELFPVFSKIFLDRLTKKFENVKSRYRASLTQLGRCTVCHPFSASIVIRALPLTSIHSQPLSLAQRMPPLFQPFLHCLRHSSIPTQTMLAMKSKRQ